MKARQEEVEDVPEILEEKCMRLAAAISRATSLAVYTGAGISTAASIPDYRGTNGVWTRMQQGKDIGYVIFKKNTHLRFLKYLVRKYSNSDVSDLLSKNNFI